EPEQQDRPNRIEQDSPPGVLEHIMADLVAGYGADLVERSILQRDVGNGDAGRIADAAGIGGKIVRLARAVEHEHPLRRNACSPGHFDHGVTDLAAWYRLIFVEQ